MLITDEILLALCGTPKTAAVTITIASPGVVTWTGHQLRANAPVEFSTTGALPTGLTPGVVYYVVGASITADTFQVSATPGGAAINTSGTQSGVHTGVLVASDGVVDRLEASGLLRPLEKLRLANIQSRVLAGTENLSGREAMELFVVLQRYWYKTARKSA